VRVRPYEFRDQGAWDEYVARSPQATLYHTTRWRKVLETTFPNRHYAWLAEDEAGTIRGILPLVHQRSFLFGNFLVSLPQSSYGGVCADEAGSELALIEGAIETARALGAGYIQLRQQSPVGSELPFRDRKVSMHLAVSAGEGALWEGFDAKLRSQLRRSTKDGFLARLGGREELDEFYTVFATNMRDLGTPVFPRAFFQHVLEEFPDAARLCIIARGGVAAAVAFLLAHGDTLEIPWASSLRAHKQSAPNMLLYWRAIQFASEMGYRRLDFGRSTHDSGTYRFKLQWGAVPTRQFWYYWLARPGSLPDPGPENPRFSLAVRLWRRLPLRVANALGPFVVRYVP